MPRTAQRARLRNHTALITGATRGIGLALAKALAAERCNIIITARDGPFLTKVGRELARTKISVLAHPCDVRDPHSVDDLFRTVRRDFPRLDILINNAGI